MRLGPKNYPPVARRKRRWTTFEHVQRWVNRMKRKLKKGDK